MLHKFAKPHRSLQLSAFVAALAVLFTASAAPGSATAPSERSVRLKVHAIALSTNGDYSAFGMQRGFGDMDGSMMDLARRFWSNDEALIGEADEAAVQEATRSYSASALKVLSWDAARQVNATIPFSLQAAPPARPFHLQAATEDRARAVQCLSEAVYYEARYEPAEGQAAVAQVVLNRMRHPLYPKTVCGVVYQGANRKTGCQFTFTCDGALASAPREPMWSQARKVAERALNGYVVKSVGEATHYHADYVVPYWIPSLAKLQKVGQHIFYRWSGDLGMPAAFNGRYAGNEPATPSAMAEAMSAEAEAKATAELIERIGPVEETAPVIQLAEGPKVSTAAPIAVKSADELALTAAPEVKLPQRGTAFGIRPTCVASTLGNCQPF